MSTNEHDGPENGNRATVALVDAKVDGLKELIRAEFKDVGRRLDAAAGLEPRIRKLEQDAVGRVGPIVDALRKFETQVSELDKKVDELDRQSVSGDQVKAALEFDRDQRARRTDAQFSKREKVLGSLIALTILALQVHALLAH